MEQDQDFPPYLTAAIDGYLAFGRFLATASPAERAAVTLPFAGDTHAQIAASHAASADRLPLYDALHAAVRSALVAPIFAQRRVRATRLVRWTRWVRRRMSGSPPPFAKMPPLSAIVRRTAISARRLQSLAALDAWLPGLFTTSNPLARLLVFLRSFGFVDDDVVIVRLFATDARAALLLIDHLLDGGARDALAPAILAAGVEQAHEARDFERVAEIAWFYVEGEVDAGPRSLRVLDRAWFANLRRGERGAALGLLDRWLELAPDDARALRCKAVTLSAEPEIAVRLLERAGAASGFAAETSTVLLSEYAGRIGRFDVARAALAAAPRPVSPELRFARHNLDLRAERPGEAARAGFAAHGLDLRWQVLAVGDVEDRSPAMPSSDTLVSVVLIAFEAEDHLETAVASILGQSHRALEIFIVDDASSDATPRIAKRLAARDGRIRVIRNARNVGTYVSKNRALRLATGRYLALCDADDMWLRNHVAVHLAMMEAEPGLAVTTSEWLRLTEDGLIECGIGGRHIALCPHSTFFARHAFEAMGYFDSVRFGADAEMLRRARLHFGRVGVVHLPRILALGRRHDASLTTAGPSRQGALAVAPLRLRYATDWNAWHRAAIRSGALPMTQGTEQDRPFAVPRELQV